MKKKPRKAAISQTPPAEYGSLISGVTDLLEAARRIPARAMNAFMSATYWEMGPRIVEHEQRGQERAGYGEQLLARLSTDLTSRFGRGFGIDNLELFWAFFLTYPLGGPRADLPEKSESLIRISGPGHAGAQISETVSRKFPMRDQTVISHGPDEEAFSFHRRSVAATNFQRDYRATSQETSRWPKSVSPRSHHVR